MIKRVCFASFILLFSLGSIYAQSPDYNHFTGIKSSGLIPGDFTTPWSEKFKQNPVEINFDSINTSDLDVEEFWMHQNYAIDLILSSGKFSFGDPITNYINAVADELLLERPALRKKLRFYLYREASTNAFCLGDGIIGINNGLMTNIGSEAELAFVLAHEVAHYLEEHIYEDHFSDYDDDDQEKSELEKIEELIIRSKQQELEADSLGLKLFLESKYDTSAVSRALITLYESYHPAGRLRITGNPLAYKNSYSLPTWAQKSFNSNLSEDYDYFDAGSEHPNIATRLTAMSNHLKLDTNIGSGTPFILGVEQFQEIQTLARFENVRLNLRKANFTEALYEIECLLPEYPESVFLHKSKLRALYGLAILKFQGKAHLVVPVPYYQPGPVKDLNYSLFSLNQYELCAIGLRMANDLLAVYPEDKDIRGMQREFHRIFYSRFLLTNPTDVQENEDQLPSRTISFINSILPNLDSNNALFYQDYLADSLYRDSLLNRKIAPRHEFNAWNTKGTKSVNNYSIKNDYTYITVLDPSVHIHPKFTKLDDKQIALECESYLVNSLPSSMPNHGLFGEVFTMTYLGEEEVEQYNRYSELKALHDEIRFHRYLGFPTYNYQIQEMLKLRSPFIFISNAYVEHLGDDIVYFKVYDIRTGKLLVSDNGNPIVTLYPRDFKKMVIDKLIELKSL